MKHNYMKLFFLCLCFLAGTNASAYDACIDGIYYNLSGDEATVTYETTYNSYSGDVVIPESVTYNGKTYSVTSIGGKAFAGLSGLTSVTIPNSVTSIGDNAFRYCSGLTSVTIGNSVTSIGIFAFDGCSGLTSVHITDIAAWCNIGFSSYTSNPLYLAHHLYMNGEEIKDLVIPGSVTSIGRYAFENCSGLTSLTIPNSVTSIGSRAFFYCRGLTSVTIPNSVTSIGDDAFLGCRGLTSVTIPSSVTSIGDVAFAGCSGLETIVVETGNTVYDSRNDCNAVIETATNNCIVGCMNTTIPEGVTSIGSSAFYSCDGLISVTIPNSVTSIAADAFSGCINLTSVTLESNSIVSSPDFSTKSSLKDYFGDQVKEYRIGNSVTSIGERAFYKCSGLTSVTIPNSVTSIGSSAFDNCSGLTSVHITDVAAWCNIAFGGSSANPLSYAHHLYMNGEEIKDLVIPNSVTSIGDWAFQYCSGLTSVTIPNSVTSIGEYAFDGCSGLTSVTIGNSVTSIGDYTFCTCTSLTSLTIPNSVTSIGDRAFYGCSGLTSVTIPNSVTSIGEFAFYGCSGLTSVTFPNSVTSIGNHAFYGCSGLTSVTIPNSVTIIGSNAFNKCSSLTSVIIGNSVTNIGAGAFAYCDRLTDVYCYAENVLTINSDAFYKSPISSATLHVPEGSVESYKTTEPWSGFGSIVPLDIDVFTAKTKEGVTMTFKILDKEEKTCQVGDSIMVAIGTAQTGMVTIPAEANGYKVTAISSNSFYGTTITKVTIPKTVTTIASKAFGNNQNLEAITSESLTPFDFDDDAFDDAIYDITIMNVPQTSVPVYQSAKTGQKFSNLQSSSTSGSHVSGALFNTPVWKDHIMTFKVIGESACQVGNGKTASVFTGTAESIKIPNKVTNLIVKAIGRRGFYNCAELTRVYLSENIEEIGDEAFYGCTKLMTLDLPRKVTKISSSAFHNSGLSSGGGVRYHPGQEHLIPDSVNYEQLEPTEEDYIDTKEIHILASMKKIGEYRSYSYCRNIVRMYVDEGNPTYDSREDCNAIIRTNDNKLLYGCQNTVIPKSVTSINNYAFEGHSKLSKIKIPAKITDIGEGAFAGCTGLEEVYSYIRTPFPINDNTFSNDTYESATLFVPFGKGRLYQSTDGWKNFKHIEELDPPQDIIAFADPLVKAICVENWDTDDDGELTETEAREVTTIQAKFNEKNITTFNELKYFTSLTTISEAAFMDCTRLSSVTMPNSVTTIGSYAFSGCSKMSSISIKSSVTSIGGYAFNGCSGLSNIIIPNNVTTIGEAAFKDCSGVISITIGNGITYIGDSAFYGCNNLKTLTLECRNVGNWFSNNSSIMSLFLGINVSTISDNAFANCIGLTSVTINSVTTIGNYAFSNCSKLKSIDIPESVRRVGDYAFSGCTAMTSAKICGSHEHVGDAFQQIVHTPLTPTSIGKYAFYGCSSLEHASAGLVVTTIGEAAFCNCTKLTDFDIPYSVTNISESVFSGCSNLNNISIPFSLTNIPGYAFANCSNLTTVIIPKSVTNIDNSAFSGCKNIKMLRLDCGYIGNWFSDNESIQTLFLGDNVRIISDNAFSECSGLTSVTIGRNVTSIGNSAFNGCLALTDVTSDICTPYPISDDTFSDETYKNATLTIPSNTKALYQAAAGWKNFFNIMVLEDGDVFTAKTVEGVEMIFKVISAKDRTCQVGDGKKVSIDVTTSGEITIPELAKGYNVIAISDKSFISCGNLNSVSVPYNVTSIGNYAFNNCSSLKDVYCYAENVPGTSLNAFNSSPIASATLHVPVSALEQYQTTTPWSSFGTIVLLDEKKCATPTISYASGELTFSCETEGAVCHSTITDTDISSYSTDKVQLSVTYTISVYATKSGLYNSDVATATLCWIDVEPTMEGIVNEDAVTEVKALPVLIQAQAGIITVQGLDAGTEVSAYSTGGMLLDTIVSSQGTATLRTSLTSGSTAIVKIGDKAVKVLLK